MQFLKFTHIHLFRIFSYLLGSQSDRSNYARLSCNVIGGMTIVDESADLTELVLSYNDGIEEISNGASVQWSGPQIDQ